MPPPPSGADRATDWLKRGSFYTWRPDSGPAAGREARVFHVEAGPADAPVLLLLHGFPTSSIDWYDVFDRFAESYRVSTLDFPGYGFSDKPRDWPYGLHLDVDLLLHHVRDVLGVASCRIVAHDRGDSVALLLHDRGTGAGADHAVRIDHMLLSNGNVFLPLANLTTFQKLILDEARAKDVLEVLTPGMLAAGMGTSTFTPPRAPGDPTVRALEAAFEYNDGVSVLHQTVQYLRERADHEVDWLESLGGSDVPSTLVWGLCDTISPPRVAMHVWERYLRAKPGSNELWFLPEANHYLQNDQPEAFTGIALNAFARSKPADPGPIDLGPGPAIRVDQSSGRLRDAKASLAL